MKTEFLYKLLESSAVSGWEAPLQRVVLAEMENAADQIFVDGNGSVAAVINPDAPVKVLLDGHADEVGLVVTCANEQGLLHVAKAGETLHSISQMYGIRLKNLCKINRRDAQSPVTEGQQIRLM